MKLKLMILMLLAALVVAGCGEKEPKEHHKAEVPTGAKIGHPNGDQGTKPNHKQIVAATRIAKHPRLGATTAPPVAVPSSPTGPSTPSGGWYVAFADAFNAPIGTGPGEDPFWIKKTNSHGCCGNSSPNETNTEAPSAVHQSANGLELRCEVLVCSGISTPAFTFEVGRPERIVIECTQKLPGPAPGEDPGCWSISKTRWPPELDFPEVWMWPSECPTSCTGGFVYHSTSGQKEDYFNPFKLFGETNTAFTTFEHYTTEIVGNTVRSWISGKEVGSFTETANTDEMDLILTHAVRISTAARQTCQCVRSVVVYEDHEHAGQYVHNGGIAPGTTVAGSSEEPTKTETTPTETTPQPEASVPQAPKTCSSTDHREGATSWVGITCQNNPSTDNVTKYRLYRTAPQQSGRAPGSVWTEGTSPAWSNHLLVTQNERYCYWASAVNSKGESPLSSPTCLKA